MIKNINHIGLVFLYSLFLFCFIMQEFSIISSIKNFNKHVLIDHFHFKHETRTKEKLLNQVYKKSQSGQIIIGLVERSKFLTFNIFARFRSRNKQWSRILCPKFSRSSGSVLFLQSSTMPTRGPTRDQFHKTFLFVINNHLQPMASVIKLFTAVSYDFL